MVCELESGDTLTESEAKTLVETSEILNEWADMMDDGSDDKAVVTDVAHALKMLPRVTSENKELVTESIEDDLKDLFYAFIVHTTMLYVRAEDSENNTPEKNNERMFQ